MSLVGVLQQKEWRGTVAGKEFRSSFPAYKTEEEFYEDLSKVKPVDYKSEELSHEDAMSHSKEIMGILLKARDLDLSSDYEKVSDALKSAGCVKMEEAHEKFQEEEATVEGLMASESVGYPLYAYQQLIDTANSEDFSFGMDYLVSKNVESSDVYTWLATQKIAEQNQANTMINDQIK